MALFNTRYIEDEYIDYRDNILVKTPTHGTIVSKCMTIDGDLKSCEPIVVEGILNGNITCEDIVIVSKSAFVLGKIEAKEIRIDGRVEGPLEASVVELTNKANLEGYILADISVINGKVDGDILVKETLEIGASSVINCLECKASIIRIEGSLKGIITASKLLDVASSAKVSGSINVKELKSEDGAKIVGNISFLDKGNIITSKLNTSKNPNKVNINMKRVV